MEYKVSAMGELEYKALAVSATDAADGIVTGYVSTWGVDAEGDQIQPEAFTKTIADRAGRVPLFLNHDRQHWAGSTLTLVPDAKGVLMKGQLYLDTAAGKEAAALLRSARETGYPIGLSIGFVVKQAGFAGGVRKVSEIDLWEISLTPWPANRQALVA